MIKATDLRIGNWYVNQWGEYLQVDPDLFGADNLESYPIPICITNEILEKCGFERHGSYWSNISLDIPIQPTIKGSEILLIPNSKYAIELKYLHQLQNLYFALTNEELEFKP